MSCQFDWRSLDKTRSQGHSTIAHKPTGLISFLKGLVELRIDKALIRNHDVLAKIVRMEKQYNQTGRGKNRKGYEDVGGDDDDDQDSEDGSDEDEGKENESETEQSDDESEMDEEEDEDSETSVKNLENHCENCLTGDVDIADLKQCPDCHWVDLHDENDSHTECNACGTQRPTEDFSKTHSIHHCNNCDHTEVIDHSGDVEEQNDSESSIDGDEESEDDSAEESE